MSAVPEGRSRGDRILIGIGKGFAWLVIVAVLFELGAERADTFGGRDVHFKQGYMHGSVLLSLGVAFGLWYLVQHAIRKKRGYPPWVGLIAIGVSGLLMLVDLGKAASPAADTAQCTQPNPDPFGAAPSGWTYAEADAQQRASVLESTDLEDFKSHVDVSLASRPGAEGVILLRINDSGGPSYIAGAEHGARTKAHATISHATYGDVRASVLDYPDDRARTIVGARECEVIFTMGADDDEVATVARAILSRTR